MPTAESSLPFQRTIPLSVPIHRSRSPSGSRQLTLNQVDRCGSEMSYPRCRRKSPASRVPIQISPSGVCAREITGAGADRPRKRVFEIGRAETERAGFHFRNQKFTGIPPAHGGDAVYGSGSDVDFRIAVAITQYGQILQPYPQAAVIVGRQPENARDGECSRIVFDQAEIPSIERTSPASVPIHRYPSGVWVIA